MAAAASPLYTYKLVNLKAIICLAYSHLNEIGASTCLHWEDFDQPEISHNFENLGHFTQCHSLSERLASHRQRPH